VLFLLLVTSQASFFPNTVYRFPAHWSSEGKELSPRASLPARLNNAPAPVNSSFPTANFDEQLGFTFTQNFSGLSYNVTAVEQQDIYGYGPAYLLNGLSNLGYWYQVGLSWDWPIASGGYAAGFGFNYEVFAPNGTSIYPQNAGGLENFSGSVNPGDRIGLSLAFSTADVVMQAVDWETGSIASAVYNSSGASYFVGLPSGISNSKGFFTGLMTEQYHVNIYNGSETKVTYSGTSNVSSAWMWVDEFNANTSTLVFLKSTVHSVSYASPGRLQYFFFEGATLISNGHEFVTGTSGSVLLTVSFSQVGGAPPSPPKLVYSSNGSIQSVQIGVTPTTYLVDNGSTWSISATLPSIISSGERWTTPDTTSGAASADQTIKIVYYHQYLESISFTVLGGGSNFGSPELTFANNGRPNSILLAGSVLGIWVDAGTAWNVTNPLPGSGSLQRWVGNVSRGLFNSQQNLTLPYFHENLVAVSYSVIGGGSGYSVPEFQTTALNGTLKQSLSVHPASLWLDDGAQWKVSSALNSSSPSQRWVTQSPEGVVNEAEILPIYYHQSLVFLSYAIVGNSTGFVPPKVNWTFFGEQQSTALNSSRLVWIDYGTLYSYPDIIAGPVGERWAADSDSNITVLSQPSISIRYQTQYMVNIEQPLEGGGTIIAPPSGWYNASQTIALNSRSNPGWKLGAWAGTGTGSYSGNSSSPTLTVESPLIETAIFYPKLTIASGPGGTVSYSYDGRTGTVGNGKNVTIYVTPLTEVSLLASTQSSLELFTNWHGAINSPSDSVLVQVRAPELIGASFGFNYPLMFVSLAAIVSALLLVAITLYRRRK
jgi:hypothetical protein